MRGQVRGRDDSADHSPSLLLSSHLISADLPLSPLSSALLIHVMNRMWELIGL